MKQIIKIQGDRNNDRSKTGSYRNKTGISGTYIIRAQTVLLQNSRKLLTGLKKQLKKVTDKLSDIAELTGSDRGGIQKPPHY